MSSRCLARAINCAHPDHLRAAVANGETWTRRIGGIRANARSSLFAPHAPGPPSLAPHANPGPAVPDRWKGTPVPPRIARQAQSIDDLTFDEKRKVEAWKVLINRAEQLMQERGLGGFKPAALLLFERIEGGLEPLNVVDSAQRVARGKRRLPSYGSLNNKQKAWKGQGDNGLFDKYRGHVTGLKDWWVPFLQYWLSPQKRKAAPIARKLRARGFKVDDREAQRFVQALPENLGEYCRERQAVPTGADVLD